MNGLEGEVGRWRGWRGLCKGQEHQRPRHLKNTHQTTITLEIHYNRIIG